jgi:hypothetical protein
VCLKIFTELLSLLLFIVDLARDFYNYQITAKKFFFFLAFTEKIYAFFFISFNPLLQNIIYKKSYMAFVRLQLYNIARRQIFRNTNIYTIISQLKPFKI